MLVALRIHRGQQLFIFLDSGGSQNVCPWVWLLDRGTGCSNTSLYSPRQDPLACALTATAQETAKSLVLSPLHKPQGASISPYSQPLQSAPAALSSSRDEPSAPFLLRLFFFLAKLWHRPHPGSQVVLGLQIPGRNIHKNHSTQLNSGPRREVLVLTDFLLLNVAHALCQYLHKAEFGCFKTCSGEGWWGRRGPQEKTFKSTGWLGRKTISESTQAAVS